MINYTKHFIDKKDINAVTQVLQSENITQGKKVLEFEKSLNKYFGSKNSVVVSNATIALYLLAKKTDYVQVAGFCPIDFVKKILILKKKPNPKNLKKYVNDFELKYFLKRLYNVYKFI